MASKEKLFSRLSRLFKSGPLVKRKVKGVEKAPSASSALDLFRKSSSNVYNNAIASYGQFDRMCLKLNTKIAIPGIEKFKTLQQLIEEYPNGEKFIVYSYDHEKKCLVPAWAHHPRSSGFKQTVKIIFDDGSELICTPDHPCMMRDGTYRDAGELKVGDSMMPFYRKNDFIYNCKNWIEETTVILNPKKKLFKANKNRLDLNHKVAKVIPWEVVEVGDLTVDGFENFATDTIIVHNSRYADFSEMEYEPIVACIGKESIINTPLGDFTIEELLKKYPNGESFLVYCFDEKQHCLTIGNAHSLRKTKTDETLKVFLDSGESITCTKDHKFLLRNGNWVEAQNLKQDDSLMPFYKQNGKQKKGYFSIYSISNGWQLEHRFVAEHVILKRPLKGRDEVVHHINFNKCDNSPNNLLVCSPLEHAAIHAKTFEKAETMRKVGISLRGRKLTEKHKKKVSDGLQLFWELNPNAREIASKIGIENYKNYSDEKKEQIGAGIKYYLNSSEGKKAMSERTTLLNQKRWEEDKEYIEKMKKIFSLKAKKLWENEEWAEWKRNYQSKVIKQNYIDNPELRKLVASPKEKNGNFKKEISYDDIFLAAQNFEKLSEFVRHFHIPGITAIQSKAQFIRRRLRQAGYNNWSDFKQRYEYKNHKIIKIEAFKVQDVYDLTVDQYANFACNGVIIHNSSIDVYSDECVSQDDKGRSLHIHSNNPQIQKLLEELFYDTLNVEFNLRPWVRNLCKYGDFFIFNDVDETHGIINVFPIPVNEIEREEGYNPDDPLAVRFRWVTQGNQILENWQVTHMRLLGNDSFLPYGSSILEPARRVWRQLCLHSNTLIWTPDGYKKIKDVKAGEEVFSYDYEKNEVIKTKVKNCSYMGKQNTFKVRTTHRTIITTDNHGLLVKNSKGEFLYKATKDLKNYSDKLALPIIENQEKDIYANLSSELFHVRLKNKHSYNSLRIMDKIRSLNISTTVKNFHGFLNGKRSICYNDFLIAKEVFDINVNDVILHITKSKNKFLKNPLCDWDLKYKIDVDFIRFFGFMLGDGWVNETSIGFALGEYEYLNEKYINYANSFHAENTISRKEGTKSAFISYYSCELAEIFRSLGFKTGFAKKRIPNWVFELPISLKLELIEGFFDADGSEDRIQLANEPLITDLHVLCQSCGIPTGKLTREKREGFAYDKSFKKIIFRQPSFRFYANFRNISEDHTFENVISVEPFEENSDTWDLEIDHPLHNFIADGVVSHNTLMEDSMLTYRIVRSPERRVFYIDVGAIPPDEVLSYMEQAKQALRQNEVVDKSTGRTDQRYKSIPTDYDYFLPTRGGETGTKIDTLPGGQNTTATDDVEYFKSKLFAALKIPPAYLGYADGLSSKSTLSQLDIRFSRTINMIQRVVIAELNKIASIHLFAHGFTNEDLLDFVLYLSNPSTVAQQQKLEIYRTKFEIAGTIPDNLVDLDYVRRNILGMTNEEITVAKKNLELDRKFVAKLDKYAEGGQFSGGNATLGGGAGETPAGGEEGAGGAKELNASQDRENPDEVLLTSNDDIPIKAVAKNPSEEVGDNEELISEEDNEDENDEDEDEPRDGSVFPIKANNILGKYHYNRKRRRNHGSSKTQMPDHAAMTSYKNSSLNDPYDNRSLGIHSPSKMGMYGEAVEPEDKLLDEFWLKKELEHKRMNVELKSTLQRMEKVIGKKTNNYFGSSSPIKDGLLTETINEEDSKEIDESIEEDDNETTADKS